MTTNHEVLWTVARFPDGSWATGGKSNDPDYADCEIFLIWASSRDEAKRKGQARRAQLRAKEKRAAAKLARRANPDKPAIEPQALFDYACNYNRRAKAFGSAEQYPSFREAAKHFHATLADVEQACEDWDGSNGYMRPAVGVRTARGAAAYTSKGHWRVEAYK